MTGGTISIHRLGVQGLKGDTGAGEKGEKGDKGDTGDAGPANTLSIGTVTEGAADATITGTAPAQTLNLTIPKGDTGDAGADGWTPVLAVVADSDRYVQQVADWVGGTGTKPATGDYVGPTGLVASIGSAVNIRGASGDGTGDVSGPASSTDSELVLFDGTTGKLIKGGGAPFDGAYSSLSGIPSTFTPAAHTHTLSDITDAGTAAAAATGDFATAAQGSLADSAIQAADLATVATTGDYDDLSNKPSIPSGTVESVAITVPTGLAVSGSPVTTTGTFAVTWDTGYQGYTTTEANKLSGIEGSADVTDATNVAAAGAVMDGDFSSNGMMARTSSGTYASRTITAGTAISVSNGTGQSGNPTISVSFGTTSSTAAVGNDSRFTQSAISTKTSSYTFALADAGTTVYMNSGSTRTLTVPPNSSVAIPVGSYINVGRLGTGSVTLVAGSGVTIRNANGLVLASQYSLATLHKIATDEWIAGGDLTT